MSDDQRADTPRLDNGEGKPSSHVITKCDHGMSAHNRWGCVHCACKTPGFGFPTETERERIALRAEAAAEPAAAEPPDLRAALTNLLGAVAQFLDEYESEDGSAYEDELRDMAENAVTALAAQPPRGSQPDPVLRQRLGEFLWRNLGTVNAAQAHDMARDFLASVGGSLPDEPPDDWGPGPLGEAVVADRRGK